MNLKNKILIYIAYCLGKDGKKFSYEKLKDTLKKFDRADYSIGTLCKEFSILKTSGLITFKTHYRKPYPVLTTEGKLKISSRLPYKKFDPWDEKWRVIVINVPEKERKARTIFQIKLLELGFKKIGRSTFITAHPLLASANRIANELGICQNCLIIETTKLYHQDIIVEKIWRLDEIGRRYKKFLKRAKLKLKSKKNITWVFSAKELENEFKEIYRDDPHLPEDFLPRDWMQKHAYETYKQIVHSY